MCKNTHMQLCPLPAPAIQSTLRVILMFATGRSVDFLESTRKMGCDTWELRHQYTGTSADLFECLGWDDFRDCFVTSNDAFMYIVLMRLLSLRVSRYISTCRHKRKTRFKGNPVSPDPKCRSWFLRRRATTGLQ